MMPYNLNELFFNIVGYDLFALNINQIEEASDLTA